MFGHLRNDMAHGMYLWTIKTITTDNDRAALMEGEFLATYHLSK